MQQVLSSLLCFVFAELPSSGQQEQQQASHSVMEARQIVICSGNQPSSMVATSNLMDIFEVIT
jgi:hypothetical protein